MHDTSSNPPQHADRIVRSIVLRAPRARVWRALTDHEQFGTWFRARLSAPFVPGRRATGAITYPGYEHLKFDVDVVAMEPEHYFAFRWHPYPIDPAVDYSQETPTLVEFRLADADDGTRLEVVESGFERLPAARRDEAFRMNSSGWSMQMQNVHAHVEG